MIHLAITNLAALCRSARADHHDNCAWRRHQSDRLRALIVTIVTDSVILYPVQTASNLIAYETGYFRGADVRRMGIAMLGFTILVGLCIAIPYGRCLGCRCFRLILSAPALQQNGPRPRSQGRGRSVTPSACQPNGQSKICTLQLFLPISSSSMTG